jgi:hypothetical protein
MKNFLLLAVSALFCVHAFALSQDEAYKCASEFVDAQVSMNWEKMSKVLAPSELRRWREPTQPVYAMLQSNPKGTKYRTALAEKFPGRRLEALTDAEFFQLHQSILGDMYDETRDISGEGSSELLGSIREGETFHVLFRISHSNFTRQSAPLSVVSVIPFEDSARALLTKEMSKYVESSKLVVRDLVKKGLLPAEVTDSSPQK